MKEVEAAPTWAGILPVYLEAIINGTESGRQAAIADITRMAQALDKKNKAAKELAERLILYVTDEGDPSVGIRPVTWAIEVPFELENKEAFTESDQENLENFRQDIKKLYRDYCDAKCTTTYDFELRMEAEEERQQDAALSPDPEVKRVAYQSTKDTRDSFDYMDEETYQKYRELLASELGCFPANLRLIIDIDGVEEISSLEDHVPAFETVKELTDNVDKINPSMVNDWHRLVKLQDGTKIITIQNASPMAIWVDKVRLTDFENQLKPL